MDGEEDGPSADDGIARGRVRRIAPLAGLTTLAAGGAAAAALRSKLTGHSSADFHVRTAQRYANLFGRSKGALMKVGQLLSFASVRPVMPVELQSAYQAALAGMCSQAPPMAPELTRTVLERELREPPERLFAEFDWEPLAAASIGQVHAARLHDGRAVAVKVQYPGAADAIRADLKNAELLGTFLSLLFGTLAPRRMLLDLHAAGREIAERIGEELDYRLEACNQAEFARHYRGHPFIHVPDVIAELSTANVLTQELVDGRSWDEALVADRQLRDQWAEAIHRFVFGSYRRMRVFNADPHPGNYLFHDDGSVSFLDFGSVKRLDREHVELRDAIFRECLRGDVTGTWHACLDGGLLQPSDPVTPEDVFAYFRDDNAMLWAERPFEITPTYAAMGISRRYSPIGPSSGVVRHLRMPPEFTFMIRVEMGVASVIAQLHASADWGAIAAEHYEHAAPRTAMGRREHAFFDDAERR